MAMEGIDLPDDLLMEILSRLRVKSLIRFKSVSKKWHSLIQNPSFISLHRTRAQSKDCISVVLVRNLNDSPLQLSLYLLFDQTSTECLDLSFTKPHHHKRDFINHASSNGLVCLFFYSDIVICNPATRECRLLPQPPCHTWKVYYTGFAFDSKTKDYKVVIVRLKIRGRLEQKIQIYGMNADLWEEIVVMVPIPNCRPHQPLTSFDGVFYWLSFDFSRSARVIAALNVVEGSFERRSWPAGVSSEWRTNLCLMNDSLALILTKYDNKWQGETRFDIWLRDQFGVEEFWTKKYTIGPLLGDHTPFCFQPNSEVLLTTSRNGQIASYNHSTREIKEYKQLCDLQGLNATIIYPYSESLVSVKR